MDFLNIIKIFQIILFLEPYSFLNLNFPLIEDI